MEDAKYLPALMVAAGGMLQWLRQFKSFREWHYHVIAVALGVLAYWLVTPLDPALWRTWLLSCVEFLTVGGGLALIFGGTFITSNGAKAIVAANPSTEGSLAVPVTNSK